MLRALSSRLVLVACLSMSLQTAVQAVERAIDKDVLIVALHHVGRGDPGGSHGKERDDACRSFDRAWGNVLANLQTRYAAGGTPIDWTDWLEQMKAATPAAS